jgi:hypothetical protein
LVLLAALLIAFWLTDPFSSSPPPVEAPRVSVPLDHNQPIQNNLAEPSRVRVNDYQLTLLAEFSIDARVLGREDYRLGREADLSP